MNLEPKNFPFGNPLIKVEQTDKTPKKVFILGVYASAVHAKWFSQDHKLEVRALAVASEPYIFWAGDKAGDIISGILVPEQAGYLKPAEERFNGPSGKALNNLYLEPLHLTRQDVWLTDLIPYSCVNDAQWSAIRTKYLPVAAKHGLPMATIDQVPKKLADDTRKDQIMEELLFSNAQTIILLGDKPIKFFLTRVCNCKERSLEDFKNNYGYGRPCEIKIGSITYIVVPLAHPRQTSALGKSSQKWKHLHEDWMVSMRSKSLVP